jgi:hypothetical protein
MFRIPLVLAALATIAVALLGSVTPAAAEDWSLHILGNAQLGWTDNLQSVSDDEDREADAYAQLTPGLLLSWSRPRMVHQLSASLESNVYFKNDEGSSFAWHGGWRGFFLLSPLSELETAVSTSGGTTNTFRTSTTAANGQVMLFDSTASEYAALDASEGYSRQLSRHLRMTENGFASVVSTRATEPAGAENTGYRVGGGLGIDRAWRFNAVGATTSVSYDGLGGGRTQMNVAAGLAWRRDISIHWTSVVDVGAVTLVPLAGSDAEAILEPTIGAQIAYYPTWGTAGFGVRRSVTPNLYIAANTISDTASLSASLPLTWLPLDPNRQPRFVFSASGGYAFTSVIESDTGDTLSGFQAGLGTAELAYAIKPRVNVSLRYQYERQVADSASTLLAVRSYDRNTVMLSLSGRWPDELAGEVPTRQSLRVDRSDVTPVGEEVPTPPPTP